MDTFDGFNKEELPYYSLRAKLVYEEIDVG